MANVRIEIQLEELQKRKIFIGTPMYGGQCAGLYTKSLTDLSARAAKLNLDFRFQFFFNESLITRARNYIADEFLRSDCTHLLFIDSDIGFNPEDVLALAALSDDEHQIVCAPYPKKTISWEKIKLAVDKGIADKDPEILEQFVGDYVFNPADGQSEGRIDKPLEVLESGTGMMMISRNVFEKFREAFPERSYKPDHVRTKSFDGSREIHAFFDCVIDPETKRYLSEDYMFCQYARKIGIKTWLMPWMQLQHVGSYIFGGSLEAVCSIGASATADVSKLRKKK